MSYIMMWGCAGVSMLDCQSRGLGFKSRPKEKFDSRFLLHLHLLANSAIMGTLTIHCQWEDETARKRTGHPPSYAEAKTIKSLTLHTHGCSWAGLRDCSSSALLYYDSFIHSYRTFI